jgi:nucleotide-binding universal stress UspA family protein
MDEVTRESGVATALHITAATSMHVAEQISELTTDLDADLIVIGPRGHSALVGVVIGSVTQRLLHLAHCPVLAIPPSATAGFVTTRY